MNKATFRICRTVNKMAVQVASMTFPSAKVEQENDDLHKTSTYLAEQARAVERAMERRRWEKV